MGVSRRDGLAVDEAVLIHAGVDRIAVGGFHVATAVGLDVPACLGVALGLASYAFSGSLLRRLNWRGVDNINPTLCHDDVLDLKLPIDLTQ